VQAIRLRQPVVQMFPDTIKTAYDSSYTLNHAARSASARA
jgi:hypothetical protein